MEEKSRQFVEKGAQIYAKVGYNFILFLMAINWKDALLSSGVPLEYSVRRILESLDIADAREYKYLRPNENGIETQFSIDLRATHINFKTNHWLELFIECKYRKDGTSWIFAPDTFSELSTSPFSSTFVHLDLFSDSGQVNEEVVDKFAHNYTACSKGVELTDAGCNPKSIAQALSQLKYGLVDNFVDCILHQVDHLLGDNSPIFSHAAFVVTTADLWRLKEGVTISDIRAAKDLQDVATNHDLLFCFEPPDNELQRYAEQKFRSSFTTKQIEWMDRVAVARGGHSFQHYTDVLARSYPCYFAIIGLPRLHATLARTMDFFSQEGVFLKR